MHEANPAVVELRSANERRGTKFLTFYRLLLLGGLAVAFGLGGPVVKTGAVAAALLALLGDRDGAVRHFFRVGALLLAVWLAPKFGPGLGAALAGHAGLPLHWGQVAGIGLVAIGILIVVGLVSGCARKAVRKSAFGTADRFVGGLLGAGEGALLVAALCWLLGTLQPTVNAANARIAEGTAGPNTWLTEMLGQANTLVASDPAGRMLTEANPLGDMPGMQSLQQFSTITMDRAAVEHMIDDPRMRGFIELPVVQKHVQAVRNSAGLREALEQRDLPALLQNNEFRAMLADGELYAAITIHWDELQAAIQAAQPPQPVAR